MNLLDFGAAAIRSTQIVVDATRADQLGNATPCAGWTVRDLLAHLVGGNVLYVAAASGAQPDWSARDAIEIGLADDPATQFRASSAALAAAVARPGALEVDWSMPWGDTPGNHAVAVHAVDVLVHGWDLAVATRQDVVLDAGLSEYALAIVAAYPASAWGDGGFFADPVDVDPSTPPGLRLVAALGRTP